MGSQLDGLVVPPKFTIVCMMSGHEVWVIFDPWKGTLDVVVACVTIIFWIINGEVPVPDTKLMERIGEMERWFVDFARPVVDCE